MIGLPDDAFNHYQKAVTINPKFAEAHRNLSKLKVFQSSDPQITLMNSLYSEEGVHIVSSLSEHSQDYYELLQINGQNLNCI